MIQTPEHSSQEEELKNIAEQLKELTFAIRELNETVSSCIIRPAGNKRPCVNIAGSVVQI